MDITYKYPSITAKVLKSLRAKRSLTQYELGDLYGTSSTTISRIERSIKKLFSTDLERYLRCLNISTEEFIGTLEPLVRLQKFSETGLAENIAEENLETLDATNRLDDRSSIISFLKRYFQDQPVKTVYLFGSVARDDFDENSDIDLYLDFKEEAKTSLFDLGRMKLEISKQTGRKTDLVVKGSEYSFVRDNIEADKISVYE